MHRDIHLVEFTTLSVVEELDNEHVIFWASVNLEPDDNNKFQFCAFSKDRILNSVPENQYTEELSEAKCAVLDFLISQKVIDSYKDVKETEETYLLPRGLQIVEK